ncbi:hypothetical protein K438DRAFT_1966721 [Mycena galopus ATCC 62051]|nr:hypothetical protein K438DRAFT_1966721 [Mycena galopus ATCC 62051]
MSQWMTRNVRLVRRAVPPQPSRQNQRVHSGPPLGRPPGFLIACLECPEVPVLPPTHDAFAHRRFLVTPRCPSWTLLFCRCALDPEVALQTPDNLYNLQSMRAFQYLSTQAAPTQYPLPAVVSDSACPPPPAATDSGYFADYRPRPPTLDDTTASDYGFGWSPSDLDQNRYYRQS